MNFIASVFNKPTWTRRLQGDSSPRTCSSVYPSRFSWCELQSFGGISQSIAFCFDSMLTYVFIWSFQPHLMVFLSRWSLLSCHDRWLSCHHVTALSVFSRVITGSYSSLLVLILYEHWVCLKIVKCKWKLWKRWEGGVWAGVVLLLRALHLCFSTTGSSF